MYSIPAGILLPFQCAKCPLTACSLLLATPKCIPCPSKLTSRSSCDWLLTWMLCLPCTTKCSWFVSLPHPQATDLQTKANQIPLLHTVVLNRMLFIIVLILSKIIQSWRFHEVNFRSLMSCLWSFYGHFKQCHFYHTLFCCTFFRYFNFFFNVSTIELNQYTSG